MKVITGNNGLMNGFIYIKRSPKVKYCIRKPKGAIKNGQSRDTYYFRHKTQNEDQEMKKNHNTAS